MLVLAGCVGQVPPSTADTAPAQAQLTQGAPRSELQNCREFTVQVTVAGQPRQAVGQACQQPDGSWQVMLDTPGLPQQVYTLPPQAISLYSYPEQYYWDPLFYGPPFFVGYPVFLAHGFHRFHHHGGFHHGGFHHGGSHHGGFHGGRR
jgi:hypothetical protein